MLRYLLRPLAARLAPRVRNISSKSKMKQEHDPTLLLPKIHGYEDVNVAYRCIPKEDVGMELLNDLFSGFVWFWLFYHMYHFHGMLYEHHDFPDPEKWTDEELGLPPME